MNRLLISLSALVAAIVVVSLTASAAFAGPVPGRYIVVLKSGADPGAVSRDQHDRFGATPGHLYRRALDGFVASIPAGRVDDVRRDPRVASVVQDRTVQATGTQALAAGDSIPTGVRRAGAADGNLVETPATSAVAIIDTGIDLSHPDLNAVAGKNCVGSGAPADDNGHGSHVAGTIAARNDGAGVVGVAPGTPVYAVKVLDSSGSGTWSQVICGIDWVAANAASLGIKVANMSLGGGGTPLDGCPSATDPLHTAICNSTKAGVAYAVAAGNSGWDFDYGPQPDVPAAYPEVLTVTAMSDSDGVPGATGGAPSCRSGESDDRYASFSNWAGTSAGAQHVIDAPGVCIRSSWLGGGYNTISGTSMATPHIAGLLAACFDAGRCTSPAQSIGELRSEAAAHATSSNGFTGDPLHPVSGRYYGYLAWGGVVDPNPPGYTLSASPSSVSVRQNGAAGTTTVTASAVNGFSASVSLSVNCPSRVTCGFSPNPTTKASTLSLRAARNANVGTYKLTVTGKSGGVTRTTPVTLTVTR
jgi:subtilisin